MGEKLFSKVTGATGLPVEAISKELEVLIEQVGFDRDTVTLDQLRIVLAEYVQDILLEAKEDLEKTENQ